MQCNFRLSKRYDFGLSFKDIRERMVDICELNQVKARYNTDDNHGIFIPGFNQSNGFDGSNNKWEGAICSAPISVNEDIVKLRQALKSLQLVESNKSDDEAILDCSSYIQLVFFIAVVDSVEDNSLLKCVLNSFVKARFQDCEELIIAPAGAKTADGYEGFLFSLGNFVKYNDGVNESQLGKLIKTCGLNNGDMIYIENHPDYETWDPQGAWAGEWCVLTSTQSSPFYLYGFGLDEKPYKDIVSELAHSAYEAKKNYDTKSLRDLRSSVHSNRTNWVKTIMKVYSKNGWASFLSMRGTQPCLFDSVIDKIRKLKPTKKLLKHGNFKSFKNKIARLGKLDKSCDKNEEAELMKKVRVTYAIQFNQKRIDEMLNHHNRVEKA